jgi:hypothetical protein
MAAHFSRKGVRLLGLIALCGMTTYAHAGSIDMPVVYETRLGWNNTLRGESGLS